MNDILLDAGFFIGHERRQAACTMWTQEFNVRNTRVATVATVVSEVWRDGGRQARLARFLQTVEVVPVDLGLAQATGRLLAAARSSAAIDASLVACAASRGAAVLTSDPDDLGPLTEALGVPLLILSVR